MYLQIAILILLAACSSTVNKSIPVDSDWRDQLDFEMTGKSSAENFVNKNYERLAKLPELELKGKSFYLSRQWGDEAAARNRYTSFMEDSLGKFYGLFNHKVRRANLHYYVRDTGGKETLVYFPAPQMSLWVNAYFVRQLAARFPRMNLVYIDTSKFLLGSSVQSMDAVTAELDHSLPEILSTGGIGHSRVSAFTVCLAFLFARDHLEKHRERYHQLIAYAPMIKNTQYSMSFSPELLFGETGDFDQSDIFHLHNFILAGQTFFHPVPKRDRRINGALWREVFRMYDTGVSVPQIKNTTALVSLNDYVIPEKNSQIERFHSVEKLPYGHLESFYREKPISALLETLSGALK